MVLPEVKQCRRDNNGHCDLEKEKIIMRGGRAFYLGSGIDRDAFSFRGQKGTKCVVKVPGSEGSTSANIAEIEAWKKLPVKAKKHFIEVTDYNKNGEWITQPRVKILKELGYTSSDRLVQNFDDDVRDKGILCDDLHAKNLGVYEKDVKKKLTTSMIKILDYGFGVCYMSKELSSKNKIWTKRDERKSRRSSSHSERVIIPELFSIFD